MASFVILVVVVVFIVIITTGSASRRNRSGAAPQRGCAACGAAHPNFARFCRRCGKPLA